MNETIDETLVSVHVNNRELTYSIEEGSCPVAKEDVDGFVGEVSVIPITENDTALVVWASKWNAFKSGSVADFCNPIYFTLGFESTFRLEVNLDKCFE